MNNRFRSRCLHFAVCAVALAPVPALADSDVAFFGMSGLVAGETARLSVTNVAAPATSPGAPCRAELSFVDAAGSTVLNADSQPYVSQVTLSPGTSASLTLPAPGSAVGLANRFTYRPVVRQLTTGNASTPGCLLGASHEVVRAATGGTLVQWPPSPIFPPDPIQPQDPTRVATPLGPLNIAFEQTLRFSAVNVSQKTPPNRSCQVELRFVGPDGLTLVNDDNVPVVSQVTLAPGASTSLDFNAPALARPVIRQIGTPNTAAPQCVIVTSAQLLGVSTGSGGAVASPQDPTIPAGSPQDPTRNAAALFGFAGMVAGQTARVNVVNIAAVGNPPSRAARSWALLTRRATPSPMPIPSRCARTLRWHRAPWRPSRCRRPALLSAWRSAWCTGRW